jgi:hypothetical protein
MPSPHPLAALWQPSYLHEVDQLAQAAADSALAALEPDADPDILGIRFVGDYRRLHKQLEPFRQHDLDRLESWPPQAHRRLLITLLDILSVLEKLEPPKETVPRGHRRKARQEWVDPGDAARSLRRQRPTVVRLYETAAAVHDLLATLLAPPPDAPVGPHQPVAPVKAATQLPDDQGAEATFVQKAVALILANPGWPVERYAEKLDCHRSTLYRSPIIKRALETRHGSKNDLPGGFKDRNGSLDAWDGDE